MRIGIVSNINCDVAALHQALENMQPVDRVLCAGELVLQYRFSNEVFGLIRQHGIATVQGNHEAAILSSAGAAMRRSGTIRPDNLAFLENLPLQLEIEIEGRQIVVIHTSIISTIKLRTVGLSSAMSIRLPDKGRPLV